VQVDHRNLGIGIVDRDMNVQPVVSGKAGSRLPWGRALALWLAIALAETVHGVLRGLWLLPRVGEVAAQRIGFGVGCVIVLGIATWGSRWLGAAGAAQRWQVGVLWGVLMAGFEWLIGLARGFDARRIAAEFDPTQGGTVLYALLLMVAAPTLGAWLRHRRG
jgi:hypothetical protein